MNGITTIASLPGSGSGCQSALPAERTFTLYPDVPKPLDVQIPEPPNWLMKAIVERLIANPIKEWLQSDEAQKAIKALKVPAVGKSSVECRATITTPESAAPAVATHAGVVADVRAAVQRGDWGYLVEERHDHGGITRYRQIAGHRIQCNSLGQMPEKFLPGAADLLDAAGGGE